MQVIVYTQPSCQPCKAVKHWLTDHQISYQERPAKTHAKYLSEVLEATSTPVTVIQTDQERPVAWACGYNPEWLKTNFAERTTP